MLHLFQGWQVFAARWKKRFAAKNSFAAKIWFLPAKTYQLVSALLTQTLYNKTQMVLEQCKLTMEFKSNADLNNARYDATANKYDTET